MQSIDFNAIRAAAEQVRQLCDDDDPTFFDTLDAACSAVDVGAVLDALIEAEQTDRNAAAALRLRICDLKARAERIEGRADALRKTMLAVMQAAGLRKAERPLATLSRRDGGVSVAITDADAVPSQLCIVTRNPDKLAIRRQIEAGEIVPGAALMRGPETLSVRVR